MLYILIPDKSTGKGTRSYQWHTSDSKTSKTELPFQIQEVVEVQADGDELAYILNRAVNLPQRPAHCRVQNWFGDDAKWIVSNIIASPW
jgi:hypothetical protein